MRTWLEMRRQGQVILPDPDAKTSCLRPARSTTLREKLEKGMLPAGSQMWSSSASTPVQERLMSLEASESHPLPDGATLQGSLYGGGVAHAKVGAALKRPRGGGVVGSARKKPAGSPMPWVSPTGQAAVDILQNMLVGMPGGVEPSPGPGVSPIAPGAGAMMMAPSTASWSGGAPTPGAAGAMMMMAPPSSAKRAGPPPEDAGVPDLLSPLTLNATELLRQLSKPVDTVSPPALPVITANGTPFADHVPVVGVKPGTVSVQPATNWREGFL